jgi:hypothetical protein
MRFSVVIALVCFLGIAWQPLAAQEKEQLILTETVEASFGKVWDAIKFVMETQRCGKPQTEKIIEPDEEGGLYKGLYISDFCVLATGEDSTRDQMEPYGDLPRIRGGIWISGRIQYKINVKEEGRRNTKITLRAEMSGFEEFITNQVHFWYGNGELERKTLADIVAKVKTATTE